MMALVDCDLINRQNNVIVIISKKSYYNKIPASLKFQETDNHTILIIPLLRQDSIIKYTVNTIILVLPFW